MAVASALPLTFAILEVDTCEDAAVKAESMAIVDDEIIEVRLQPIRSPALLDIPSVWTICDREAASPAALIHADQNIAVGSERRLHDRIAFPLMFPEQL